MPQTTPYIKAVTTRGDIPEFIDDETTSTGKTWSSEKISELTTISHLTRAEYDALTDAQKDEDRIYDITDEEMDVVEVDQTYDPESENAQSGKAVADAVENAIHFPNYTDTITIPSGSTEWVATANCYIVYSLVASTTSDTFNLKINGSVVSTVDASNNVNVYHFCGFIKKGATVQGYGLDAPTRCRFFRLY